MLAAPQPRADDTATAASLATALTGLALARRLTWHEVEGLLQVAEADTAQALRDQEFDAWWGGHIMNTRRLQDIYALLEPRWAG